MPILSRHDVRFKSLADISDIRWLDSRALKIVLNRPRPTSERARPHRRPIRLYMPNRTPGYAQDRRGGTKAASLYSHLEVRLVAVELMSVIARIARGKANTTIAANGVSRPNPIRAAMMA